MATALENLITQARNVGVPKDQLGRFLNHGYVPLPWQLKFHAAAREADKDDGPTKVGAGGARGPGKSHAVFSQVALDDCQRVKALKCLFLRQTGKAAQESFEDLITRALRGRITYNYQPSRQRVTFSNGSKILLGGFETEKDIDKYIGIEYDLIAVEELNQITESKVEKLLGSLRTSKTGWRPRFYASFNPGGVGHSFVKKLFVTPHKKGGEVDTRFVPSTYKDNPFLNKEYLTYLEGLTSALGKAWREGNFDTFEGQYFEEWDDNRHVVVPFIIPPTWKRYRAYDHGRAKPACCLWFAVDYDGRVYVYREFYASGLNVDDCATHTDTTQCNLLCERKGIANEINRLSVDENYDFSVADPSIFATHGMVDRYGGQTIAETFARRGVVWFPASNRRVDGWNLMHQYLAFSVDKFPKLLYLNTCYNSVRTIKELQHEALHPEDLDTTGEDHAADATRYFLSTLHEAKLSPEKNEVQKKLEQMKQKHESFNETYYPR